MINQGVKNRCQEDLDNGVTVRQALESERISFLHLPPQFFILFYYSFISFDTTYQFFTVHPVYKEMNHDFFGAKNLSVKLMGILKTQIEGSLPSILEKVNIRRTEVVLSPLPSLLLLSPHVLSSQC